MRVTRINTASSYHLAFFGIAPSRTDLRFDTLEVWVRVPTGLPFNAVPAILQRD
jgi:hypothetical protein